MKMRVLGAILTGLALTGPLNAQAQLLWTVGLDDNAQPEVPGNAGGPEASFVQENGGINALPGSPISVTAPQGADNDYYLAGLYTEVIPSVVTAYAEYEPVGAVDVSEEAAERAFAAADNDLRFHFNLPEDLDQTNSLSVTFDAFSLQTDQADPRYGIEVYVNGVLVQPQIIIRAPQLNYDYTTPQFTLAEVNAKVGPGADNIVSLRGINYNSDGGGNWMGIDFVQLNLEPTAFPGPTFPWLVGTNDNIHITAGTGGGPGTTFVQENGATNALPGNPNSPKTNQQADDDYYFAGSYTNVIATNGEYEPVGIVAKDEEAAERAFAGEDNFLRYHFNLPNELSPNSLLAVTVEPLDLDTSGASPQYGLEIYFNGVRVQPEITVRAAQLNTPITTPAFTLASVGALVGPGHDNIVTLRGINKSADGGGNWMGIDYVGLVQPAAAIPAPVLPWVVGQNDNAWPTVGNGGGPNAVFVQENGATNALPGNPANPKVAQQADDDYYFAGVYSTVIAGNGNYTPVGNVQAHEEAAERAFAGEDNFLRYHFNLPANLAPDDELTVSFDALNLQDDAPNPRYGVEVYFNNVLVQTQIVVTAETLGQTINTAPFTLAQVNAQVGPGFDNIVTLKGISYSAEEGGSWMGIDYVQLSPVLPAPFPWEVGRDDNGWPAGNGGGPNASFVQESGTNPLPGNPASPEVDAQADDDYYFAGEYTQVIPGNGEYEPVGTVLVNEEAAERAFAGSDNDKRYHFNLPTTLSTNDLLMLTFDFNNLDTGGADPQYAYEVYFNGVLIQEETLIRNENLDVDYTTAPFTLASVDARTGPGWDNIVTLKGINKSADGGGQWMGIDYIQLNPMPTPTFPLAIGKDDDNWPLGDGGGENTSFVQENGTINDLPGAPTSREVSTGADNDYYFAGIYTNVIAANGTYEPVGIVPRNEEAAERAFAGGDNDLRYHFNLPSTLNLTNQVTITFDAFNLDTSEGVADPRYGIEVYFNGVKVQDEIIIRTNQLDQAFTTPPFTLASVNAQLGLGHDNIVSLRGNNMSADGGGNWMGIDYVQINPVGTTDTNQPAFTAITLNAGKVTLTWTGTGTLESATSALGPWTPVSGNPASGYVADVVLTERSRFYRLVRP